MTARDEQVAVAVVVEVDEFRAPVHVLISARARAGQSGDVVEEPVSQVLVERIGFLFQVGLQLPGFAVAYQSVVQCGEMGDANPYLHADQRVSLAGGTHGSRH